MVTGTDLKQRIDTNLREVAIALKDLDEAEATWHADSELNRFAYALEWDDILGRFQMLREALSRSSMTPQQAHQFAELRQAMAAAGPVLLRLGLTTPSDNAG